MKISLSDHFNYKKLIRFTVPTIAMMIFTSIYGVVDGFFISNYAGDLAFTSINIIYPAIMMVASIGFMFGTGGSAIVAKTLGEGKKEKANQYFSMIICLEIIIGIILSSLGVIFLKPIAQLLGAKDYMMEYIVPYGIILFIGIPFFMLQNSFQSFIVTAEKPKFGLIITLFAGCTNMVLDFVLIYIFKLGVLGAGLATILSQFIGAIIPLLYFISKNNSYLRLTKPKFEFKPILKSCTNGSSEMVTNLSLSLVNILYNLQLLKYIGDNGVAAYGIIMYVGFIFVGIYLGYSIGVSPILGYHYGAGNKKELKSLFKKSIKILLISSVVLTIIAELCAPYLAYIFVGYDKKLLELTTEALRLYSVMYIILWFNIFASSFFTALNDGLTSALISFLRTLVIQIIMLYLMPYLFDVPGLWLAVFASEAVSLFISLYFILRNKKKYGY